MSRFIQLLFALFFITFAMPVLAAETGEAATSAATTGESEASTGDAEATTEAADADAKATEGDATGGGDSKELQTDEEAVEAASGLYQAISSRDWALALSLGLALLVWLLRRMKVLTMLPDAFVPWTAAALSAAGYVSASLAVPEVTIGAALLEGVVAGAAAVGLWEMLLKHLLGRRT